MFFNPQLTNFTLHIEKICTMFLSSFSINLMNMFYHEGRSLFVNVYATIYFTNRFHVAVHLFSNRSQMTSKCGKNKKVAHEA